MADLNTLTNKQLREKCLQYGLPNVPVTDSSRKILIRKLTNVMEGKPTKATTPKTAANRRKTVNATITTTVSSGDEDDFVVTTNRTTNTSASNRRRTEVPVPVAKKSPASAVKPPITNQRIVPVQIEKRVNSSYVPLINGEPTVNQRRSVSLSKSGVLTTSYNQEATKPLYTTYERDSGDEYDGEEDDLDDVEMETAVDGENHHYINTASPFIGVHYNAAPKPPEPLTTLFNKPSLYPDLHSSGLKTDYYTSLDGIRASHSSTARQSSNIGFGQSTPSPVAANYASPVAANYASPTLTSSSVNRHTIDGNRYNSNYASPSGLLGSTSPLLNSTMTKRYTSTGSTRRHTARAIDNDEIASSSDDQFEAPYLSKFSRNLDNLKSEPLLGRTSTAYGTPMATPPSRYSVAAPKRRRATSGDDGVTFAQFWQTLEQKYHLKQAFFFIMCFVVAVFVYVFFLQ